jgi:hypothetical protein
LRLLAHETLVFVDAITEKIAVQGASALLLGHQRDSVMSDKSLRENRWT